MVNAQYNVAKPNSLPIKVAAYQRRKMFAAFLEAMRIGVNDTILDIGATSDQTYSHSNYLEAWYSHKSRVTAIDIDDAAIIETLYPGIRFIQADALDLPFRSGCFDYVHSSAVLEHVGTCDKQIQFLREIWRVAREGILLPRPTDGFRWSFIRFCRCYIGCLHRFIIRCSKPSERSSSPLRKTSTCYHGEALSTLLKRPE